MSCPGRTDVRIIHRFCNERSHCKTLPLSPVISHSQKIIMIPERGLGVRGKGERRERRFPFPRITKFVEYRQYRKINKPFRDILVGE